MKKQQDEFIKHDLLEIKEKLKTIKVVLQGDGKEESKQAISTYGIRDKRSILEKAKHEIILQAEVN